MRRASYGLARAEYRLFLLTARSGSPFTVSTGQDISHSGQPNSDAANQISANVARPAGVSQLQECFNTAAITERLRTEFRFEAFHFLNHANFNNPNLTRTNGNFGEILTAANPRVLQSR